MPSRTTSTRSFTCCAFSATFVSRRMPSTRYVLADFRSIPKTCIAISRWAQFWPSNVATRRPSNTSKPSFPPMSPTPPLTTTRVSVFRNSENTRRRSSATRMYYMAKHVILGCRKRFRVHKGTEQHGDLLRSDWRRRQGEGRI